MTAELNPVQIESAIRGCSNRISTGVRVCAERHETLLKAEHAYDVAYARAYLDAGDQPAHARKYLAELATVEERGARDVAEVAHGRSAGPVRNRVMVDAGADLVLAFLALCDRPACRGRRAHGSHGASGCVDLARRAGIEVRVFYTPQLASLLD